MNVCNGLGLSTKTMTPKKNQQQPLSKKELIEVIANCVTILTFVFPSPAQLGAALTTSPDPPTQPALPKTEIVNIYQQPGSSTTIIQNKLNILVESEDNETLSKAIDAISDLQKFVFEKQNELEQSRVQLLSQGDTLNLNTEQLQERTELANNIERLQDEIANLNRIKQRIEASQEAIDWLNPETQQNALFALAKEVGDTVLNTHPELANFWEAGEANQNKRQFYFDIKNFLSLIHTCLLACRPSILERALDEKRLPLAPLPVSAYVSALEVIRDQKVPDAMSGAAAVEVTTYLNYLIGKLPLSL